MLPQPTSGAGPSRSIPLHRNGIKQSSIQTADFQAVILCGYGESLFPLTEGENATPKALLPVGNELLLDRVLTWVEESGIVDVLLLCPQHQITQITNHLRDSWPSGSHPHGLISGHGNKSNHSRAKQVGKHVAGDHSRLEISLHGLDERQESEGMDGPDMGARLGINGKSGKRQVEDDKAQLGMAGIEKRPGTARILRRWRDFIHSDFVVLPCDISPPPDLRLEQLLDIHRSTVGSLVTSLWYEKGELELKDQDAPESVLVGFDRVSEELLMIQPLEELEDDLELRMRLLSKYPDLSLTTRLLDSHVYAFRRATLDLIATREPKDLESIREDFLPWLIKAGWQDGLRERWASILEAKPDPLASAIAKSTLSNASTVPADLADDSDARQYSYTTSANATVPSTPMRTPGESLLDFKENLHGDAESPDHRRRSKNRIAEELPPLRCNMMVWKAPKSSGIVSLSAKGDKKQGQAGAEIKDAEPGLLRGNTLAAYWELNREFLRTMAPNPATASSRQGSATTTASSTAEVDGVAPNIDPRSQISPDTVIASTTKVGERSQIKKSIIGRHCVIGKNVRLTGCIVWDFVNIADGAKLENVILCNQVRIGSKAQMKDCEVGQGFQCPPDSNLKGEKLVAGQDVS